MSTPHRRWKARLFVSICMLVLALVGLIIMNIHSPAYWFYTQIMAGIYAVLSIGLFWYLNRGEHKIHRSTIWHQLLHWLGLICVIYLIAIFVNTGIMGSTQAGLVTLTCLALTIYLAGIYSDISFMLIGVTLAIFAAAAAVIESYLTVIMIPVLIIAAIVIYIIVHRQRRKEQDS